MAHGLRSMKISKVGNLYPNKTLQDVREKADEEEDVEEEDKEALAI